jgi:hypothetical protein
MIGGRAQQLLHPTLDYVRGGLEAQTAVGTRRIRLGGPPGRSGKLERKTSLALNCIK